MGKWLVLLVSLLLFLGAAKFAGAALSCSISTQPCPSPLFKMNGLNNSHAELPGQTTYGYYVCCSDPALQVSNSCSGTRGVNYDVVLNLYQATNSHVQQNNYTTYTNPVCLSGGAGVIAVNCGYATGSCASLGSGYQCVASLYRATNSHVAECGFYPVQVCCSMTGDLTPPLASISISSGSAATNNPDVVLTLTFSDPESGILDPGCQYSDNNVSYTPLGTCVPLRAWSLPGGDGQKTVYYRVFNTMPTPSNFTIKSASIILDRVAPTIQLEPHQSPTTDNTPTFTGLASDAGSGIQSIHYRALNKSNLSQEVVPWTLVSFTPNLLVSYFFTTSPLPDGNYRFEAKARDQAGNGVIPQVAFQDLSIDTTPPATRDTADTVPHSSPLFVDLFCTDNIVGCKETRYCVYANDSSPCTPSTIGSTVQMTCPVSSICYQIVRYFSADLLDNQEAVKESVVNTLDMTTPSCNMVSLSQYSTSFTVPLSWNGSDPQNSPIDNYSVYYRQGGGSWTLWQVFPASTINGVFAASQEGDYQFHCVATNNFGVTGSLSSYVSTTIDNTPPFVAIQQLPPWINQTSFIVEWGGSDPVSGLDIFMVEYKEQAGQFVVWGNYSPTVFTDIFGPNLPVQVVDGRTYFFRVKARDKGGLTNQSPQASTTIDITSPACAVGSLPPWTSSIVFAVNWSGTDLISGVESYQVQFSGDGANWTFLPQGNSTDVSFAAVDGQKYYFRCRAQDWAGNLGSFSLVVNTTVDLNPPSFTVSLPFSKILPFENLTVKATATDLVDISSVSLVFNGSLVPPETIAKKKGEWNLTWIIPGPAALGGYNFSLAGTDANNNSNFLVFSFFVVQCRDGEVKGCGSNVGECSEGQSACASNVWGACQGGVGQAAESCNDLDDNCDGTPDNSLTPPSCPLTSGVCAGAAAVCLGSSGWSFCGQGEYGSLYEQAEASCDGLDNDCDGQTDEGCGCNEGDQMECGTSDVLPCQKGMQVCGSDGTWGACSGAVEPVAEVCGNQADDNCDGTVDDGCLDGDIIRGGFPWYYFIIAGVAVIAVITVLLLYFRSKGKDFTWEELTRKWS